MTEIKQSLLKFSGFFRMIHEINERYKHPKIKMTPMVKISLLALRLYLLFMLALLLYKFIQLTII